MKEKINEIIDAFHKFSPEGNDLVLLNKLTDDLLMTPHPEEALTAMFGIFERFPEEEFGSPGPLIHAIEKCDGYESALFESLKRQPATMTIWMVFRLMKYDPQERYFEALKEVLNHPGASDQIKEDASLVLLWIESISK